MTPEQKKQLDEAIQAMQVQPPTGEDVAPRQADIQDAEQVQDVTVDVPEMIKGPKPHARPIDDVAEAFKDGAGEVVKQVEGNDWFAEQLREQAAEVEVRKPAKPNPVEERDEQPDAVDVPAPKIPPLGDEAPIPAMEEMVKEAKRRGAWDEDEQVINWQKMIPQDDAKVGGHPIQQGAELADARREAEAAHKAMLDELIGFLKAIAQQDHQARLEILQMRKAAIRSRG